MLFVEWGCCCCCWAAAWYGCSPKLVYQGLRKQRIDVPGTVNQPAPVSNMRSHPSNGRRIVWLLFDELSYDQTFDHRFPGLDLPAFDLFQGQERGVQQRATGGILHRTGDPFLLSWESQSINLSSNLDGEPMIRFAGGSHWQAFDANNTLFADAQRLGWTTGVVGWYNPYCRILARHSQLLLLADGRRSVR